MAVAAKPKPAPDARRELENEMAAGVGGENRDSNLRTLLQSITRPRRPTTSPRN